jgi:hypothetical protein
VSRVESDIILAMRVTLVVVKLSFYQCPSCLVSEKAFVSM